MIRVVISGTGQMGTLILEAVENAEDMQPVGILEPIAPAVDSHTVLAMHADPGQLFEATHPDVVVDFTNAAATPALVEAALEHGVRLVIGTSGVPVETVTRLRHGCAEQGLGAVIAPNFAIGAVMLMYMAQLAAPYFEAAEIIELHHDRKVDAPSGTGLATARLMREARGSDFSYNVPELTTIPGTRGGVEGGIPIHSVRLPGLVAHQEVLFGGQGQTLTIRHDTTGRDSFVPGVLLAIREVMERDHLVEGLDQLVGLT
ncbi:MAG: 4-hydroxy-tetrahydrodipicolinate reductase [Chloroflexi bacterium]|nr:4-hydroxy-tetrahydrodipicolinate reductase [Chloroflexota bacterium]MDA1146754.1 4-hydroxy-tetrahydrodipicolinate reductase [Chloroflexota bacterium]MQC82876.1 4-hydroxy-tetrahydrodipicolinate reductase [Chloroflexota bacterium]